MTDEPDLAAEATEVLKLMRQAENLLGDAQERARVAGLSDGEVAWSNRIGFSRRLLARDIDDMRGVEPSPLPLDPRPVENVTAPLLNGDGDPGPTEP